MKKILFAATVYSHLAAFHKPFIQMLLDKGYEVHVAANPDHGRKNEIKELGVKCWDISFSRSPFSLENIKALRQLKYLFKNQYYDLIHVHTPVAAFLVRFLAKKYFQGSILYTAHGFHFFRGAPLKNWLFYYTAEYLASKWTDGLIVMNNEDLLLGQKLGFELNKNLFYTHGVGVSIKDYNYTNIENEISKETLGFKQDDVLIICIAELIPRKNQVFLLRAWSKLQKKYSQAHLLLVGDGKDKDMIHKYINANNLKNVHLLGFRKDIPYLLAVSDIVTLVSKHEGLPRCIMEGMASKKPAVVTNVRGTRDLVKHNYNGFVVDLDDVNGLCKYLEILISDKQLRSYFGENAFKEIQLYNIDEVLREYELIYERYLN